MSKRTRSGASFGRDDEPPQRRRLAATGDPMDTDDGGAPDPVDDEPRLLPEMLEEISKMLPPSERQMFRANRRLQKAWFARVERLSPHAWLVLENCASIRRFYALRTISVREWIKTPDFDDACLAGFKQLEALYLDNGLRQIRLTPAAFSNLVNLKALAVRRVYGINDASVARLTNLQRLDLRQLDVGFTGNGLASLHHLRALTLTSVTVDGHRLYTNLQYATGLADLVLSSVAGLVDAELAKLTTLRMLSLRDTECSNAAISGMTQLSALSVVDCPNIDDNALHDLTRLAILDLSESNFTGDAPRLLPRLKVVSVSNNATVTENSIAHLPRGLVFLDISNLDSRRLVPPPRLPGLHMYPNYSNFQQLTELVATGTDTLTDAQLAHLPNLRVLNIADTRLSDASLSRLTLLERLVIGYTPLITDAGLVPLVNLNSLFIQGTSGVTHRSIQKLASLRILALIEDCAQSVPASALLGVPLLKELTADRGYYRAQQTVILKELAKKRIRLFITTLYKLPHFMSTMDAVFNRYSSDDVVPWLPDDEHDTYPTLYE